MWFTGVRSVNELFVFFGFVSSCNVCSEKQELGNLYNNPLLNKCLSLKVVVAPRKFRVKKNPTVNDSRLRFVVEL